MIVHARRIAAEVEAAGIAMRRHREGFLGRVRVGALPAILNYILLPGIVSFQRAYPNIEVVLRTGTTPELAPLLAENELDLVLGTLPVDDKAIDVEPLRLHPLLAVFPGSTRGLPDEISPAEMMRHALIVDGVSRNDALVHAWLRAAGHEPRPAMEIGDAELIKCAIAAGLGVSGPAVLHPARRGRVRRADHTSAQPAHPPHHGTAQASRQARRSGLAGGPSGVDVAEARHAGRLNIPRRMRNLKTP